MMPRIGKSAALLATALLASAAGASWYWPFGGDDGQGEKSAPRLSELMEPASLLIDEASDLAEDGKREEAIEKYREALAALDEVESSNRERAGKPEFATLRNKRAYVNATIDSLLLAQAQSNARAVAVSDTTALERRLAEERAGKSADAPKTPAKPAAAEKKPAEAEKPDARPAAAEKKPAAEKPAPLSRRAQAMADIASGEYAAAELVVAEMLAEKPDGAAALNLKAALETARGDYRAAESALDRAISVHPRSHFAYYNMARMILQSRPSDKSVARRYYDTGRSVGGPRDARLEEKLK